MSEIPVSPLPPPVEGGSSSVVSEVAPGGLLMVQLAGSLIFAVIGVA